MLWLSLLWSWVHAQADLQIMVRDSLTTNFLVVCDETKVSNYDSESNEYTWLINEYEVNFREALNKWLVNLYMRNDVWILDLKWRGEIKFEKEFLSVDDKTYTLKAITDDHISRSNYKGVSLHIDDIRPNKNADGLIVDIDIRHRAKGGKTVNISTQMMEQILRKLFDWDDVIHLPLHDDPDQEKQEKHKVYLLLQKHEE